MPDNEKAAEETNDSKIKDLILAEVAALSKMSHMELLCHIATDKVHISHLYGLMNFASKALTQMQQIQLGLLQQLNAAAKRKVNQEEVEHLNELIKFFESEAKKHTC